MFAGYGDCDDGEISRERSWEQFCSRVEIESGCDLHGSDDFDAAHNAFLKGITASDYALIVKTIASERGIV